MTPTATTFMTWKDAWLTGIREVDTQHKQLVRLLNDLHQAMSPGQCKDALGTILGSLVSYTQVHFAAEERLLRKNGYPDFVSHKQEHDRLTAKVLQFQHDFNAGGIVLTYEILNFLRDWLQGHILGTDKKYAPFLQAKGVL